MAEKYGIKITGQAKFVADVKKYEDDVKAVLDEIAGNYLGPVVLGGMIAAKKNITIVPYNPGEAANHGDCNAVTSAVNARDSAPEGVRGGQKGAGWFLGQMDNPKTPDKDERDRQHEWKEGAGTGKGSDVLIYYTPGTAGGCGGGVFGSLPDEVLFHEMVHALRAMQGLLNPIPTQDVLRGYNNEEEFLAVVTTNVYISAKPSTRLRADHRGFGRLQPPLDTSVGFLAEPENRRLLTRHWVRWKPTFQELARAGHDRRPVFNPFRQIEFQLQGPR